MGVTVARAIDRGLELPGPSASSRGGRAKAGLSIARNMRLWQLKQRFCPGKSALAAAKWLCDHREVAEDDPELHALLGKDAESVRRVLGQARKLRAE